MSETVLTKVKPDDPKSEPLFPQHQDIQPQANGAEPLIVDGGAGNGKSTSSLPLDDRTSLKCYLTHVIESNRMLKLPGIRAAGELISIELEKIYIPLCATLHKIRSFQKPWVEPKTDDLSDPSMHMSQEKTDFTVKKALAEHMRLVIIGDPGCGKSTLLRYLAVTYARDFVGKIRYVENRLELKKRRLPILLNLRSFALYLAAKHSDTDLSGSELLLNYLNQFFTREVISLGKGFFEKRLEDGGCVVLLDGMNEVVQMEDRCQVASIIERFTRRYPENRYVVTSRMMGYKGHARLKEEYVTAGILDFNKSNIKCFVTRWNGAIEAVLAGRDKETAKNEARSKSVALLEAIDGNERLQELATNPLLLTIMALVRRYRVELPERRSELYEEAVEVLLGKWDAAKGIEAGSEDLDAGDRRSLLEPIALFMMEEDRCTISVEELLSQLTLQFLNSMDDQTEARQSAEAFIRRIHQRSGILMEFGHGEYGFCHLTFQEYLAARSIVDRSDFIDYTITHMGRSWWREVVLLAVGYLGTQGRQRVSGLIQAVMKHKKESDPYHNLVLGAHCLLDVGRARVSGELWRQAQIDLKETFRFRKRKTGRIGRIYRTVLFKPHIVKEIKGRIQTAQALTLIQKDTPNASPLFFRPPWGEPEWAKIRAGEFLMGAGDEQHRFFVAGFAIAKVPITNAQYHIFVQDAYHQPPPHWIDGCPPRNLESHPVTFVSLHDAMTYCSWLSVKTGKSITLPTEVQWEKSARGRDGRIYPWGDGWDAVRCNTHELGIGQTTPVGIFPDGKSPYGCLDMLGNVWEWTTSLWGKDREEPDFKYPYNPRDGREDINAHNDVLRVLRGGSWLNSCSCEHLACRERLVPGSRGDDYGFRVVSSLADK